MLLKDRINETEMEVYCDGIKVSPSLKGVKMNRKNVISATNSNSN